MKTVFSTAYECCFAAVAVLLLSGPYRPVVAMAGPSSTNSKCLIMGTPNQQQHNILKLKLLSFKEC